MKSLKKVVYCITALSLAVSFTACGNSDIEEVSVTVPLMGEETENTDTAPDAMITETAMKNKLLPPLLKLLPQLPPPLIPLNSLQ